MHLFVVQGFTYPVRAHFLEDVLEMTGYKLTSFNQVDDYGQDKLWKTQKQLAPRKRKNQITALVEVCSWLKSLVFLHSWELHIGSLKVLVKIHILKMLNKIQWCFNTDVVNMINLVEPLPRYIRIRGDNGCSQRKKTLMIVPSPNNFYSYFFYSFLPHVMCQVSWDCFSW